jgi:POT family proton-dependent oligopeptide transporter
MMMKPHPNRLIPQQQQQQQQQQLSPSSLHQPQQQLNAISTSNANANAIIPPPSSSPSSSSSVTTEPLIHLTRISHPSHLASLPPEFLSNSTHYNHVHRPLLHVDDSHGRQDYYTYYLNPMKQAVFFILAIEMLERFSFYGINYTTTAYLTGE